MAKKSKYRKTRFEPVEVTIYIPSSGVDFKTVEIQIDRPGKRYLRVEMSFKEFWKAVCKLAARPGRMTRWEELDDD